ncbi:MAG: hypothetical protein AB7K09_02360 [Planctomycetota bacterium]
MGADVAAGLTQRHAGPLRVCKTVNDNRRALGQHALPGRHDAFGRRQPAGLGEIEEAVGPDMPAVMEANIGSGVLAEIDTGAAIPADQVLVGSELGP